MTDDEKNTLCDLAEWDTYRHLISYVNELIEHYSGAAYDQGLHDAGKETA